MPVICFFPNPLDASDRQVYTITEKTNLKQWLDDNGYTTRMRQQPLLILLNGRELLESEYNIELEKNDCVAIAAQAEGLDPATIYLIIYAVFAVALYLTMPEPQLPGETEEGSPTYTLSARGNRARLDQPKPVLYGTMRTYPDLASKPYTEFDAAGDQYVYQLFEVTLGEADIDETSARFEDTNITSFDNYEIETIQPGSTPTLFPAVVDVSGEVSSLELTDNDLGPYSANPAATLATRLAVDIVAPAGMYKSDKESGKLRNYLVQYTVQARTIDDLDQPTGAWFDLGNHTMSGASRDPIRRTHSYTVTAARYEVRILRVTLDNTNIRVSDKLNWSQLKSYIADTTATTTTRIAVRIRASEQIGNKALSKFSVVAARKLHTWNSGTGWSVNPVLTNSCVWAFADALRETYGGNRSDAYIDLLKVEASAPVLDAEGVEFNGLFDTKGTLWDTLTSILMPARCRPVDKQGVYTMVRDDLKTVPVQMFSTRNIVRDTFRIDHAGVLEETADSIRIEFFDKEQDYRPAQFTATLNGGTTNNPRDVKLFGVTDKTEAFKLAQWMNAQNFYRRRRITFETGIEGRIPTYGDLISINHIMLGQESNTEIVTGDVTAFDNVDVLTLSEKIDHITTPYIIVRDLEGAPSDAWTCTAIGTHQIRITDGGFDPSVLDFSQGYERPHFALGAGSTFTTTAKIEKISPASPGRVTIECFVDSPNVYTAADGLSVPPVTQLPNLESITPTVNELVASVGGDTTNPVVYLTWHGDNADFYQVEYSIDSGTTYLPAENGRTLEQKFTHVPDAPGVIYYRVAGVNLLRGAWTSIQVDTNSVAFTQPATPTALTLSESFTGPTCKLQWTSETYQHRVEIWESGLNKYAVTVDGTTYDFSATIAQQQGIGRAFDVRVYALAENAQLSAGYASLSVSNSAPAQLNNLAVTIVGSLIHINFDFPIDTDLAGISVWVSDTAAFTPGSSTLEIDRSLDPVLSTPILVDETRYVVVAAIDVWGNDANYSGEFSVTGESINVTEIADNFIQTPMLAANAVTAAKINVNNLSAISADMGTLTAGTVQTAASGNRAELSSSGNYPLWIGSGTKNITNAQLAFDSTTGALILRGVTIYDNLGGVLLASGAGIDYNVLGNLPASLFDISGTDGSKLAGISSGATVGATWGGNISSQPSNLAGINAGEGSKLSGIAAGATVGATSAQVTDISNAALTAGWSSVSGIGKPADSATVGAVWGSNVSNQPANLSAINSSEGSKLGGIATGATVGATSAQVTDISNAALTASWSSVSGTGKPADNADVTSANTAAAIAGQGTLATANSVSYSTVTGSKPPTNADNTGSNTAAGIAGQGALATADNVAYSSVTGTKPPTNADQTSSNTAAGISGQGNFATLNQITSGNISTYIAGAAIGNAYIGNAAITNAKIGNLAVDTVKIDDQAVTFPINSFTSAAINIGTSWTTIQSVTISAPDSAPVHISFSGVANITNNATFSLYARLRTSTGTVIHDYSLVYRPPLNSTQRTTIALMGRHTPGASSVTYQLQMYYFSGSAATRQMLSRSMLAQAIKK
jgi:Putative phage tail protein